MSEAAYQIDTTISINQNESEWFFMKEELLVNDILFMEMYSSMMAFETKNSIKTAFETAITNEKARYQKAKRAYYKNKAELHNRLIGDIVIKYIQQEHLGYATTDEIERFVRHHDKKERKKHLLQTYDKVTKTIKHINRMLPRKKKIKNIFLEILGEDDIDDKNLYFTIIRVFDRDHYNAYFNKKIKLSSLYLPEFIRINNVRIDTDENDSLELFLTEESNMSADKEYHENHLVAIEENKNALMDKANELLTNLEIIPKYYYENVDAIRKMMFLYVNKRADNIQDLINLYEETEWRQSLLSSVQSLIETLDINHNNMINVLKSIRDEVSVLNNVMSEHNAKIANSILSLSDAIENQTLTIENEIQVSHQ